MDKAEQVLRKFIRETVKSYLDEISTTGNVAHYDSPYAFTDPEDEEEAEERKVSQTPGYVKTADIDEDLREINQLLKQTYKEFPTLAEDRYSYTRFRDEEEYPTDRQQMATAVKDAKDNLKSTKKKLKHAKRFKKDAGLSTEEYWKRTHQNLNRITSELEQISSIVDELKAATDGDPETG